MVIPARNARGALKDSSFQNAMVLLLNSVSARADVQFQRSRPFSLEVRAPITVQGLQEVAQQLRERGP